MATQAEIERMRAQQIGTNYRLAAVSGQYEAPPPRPGVPVIPISQRKGLLGDLARGFIAGSSGAFKRGNVGGMSATTKQSISNSNQQAFAQVPPSSVPPAQTRVFAYPNTNYLNRPAVAPASPAASPNVVGAGVPPRFVPSVQQAGTALAEMPRSPAPVAGEGPMREWRPGTGIFVGNGPIATWDTAALARTKADEYAEQLAVRQGRRPYSASIDTGVSAASRNLAPATGGVFGYRGAQADRLPPVTSRGGTGLFTADRVKRNESKAERKHREGIELERAKNEGQIGYAQTMAEASRQDRAAAREERRAEIADNRRYEQGIARREAQTQAQKDAVAQAEKEHSRAVASQQPTVENTPSGPMRVSYDEKGIKKYESYLSPDESKAWRQAQTDKQRFRASFPPEQMIAWMAGNNTTPVMDTQTGDFVFIDNKTLGEAQKSKNESQRYAKIENTPFLGEEFANYKRAVEAYSKSMKSKKPAPAA